MFSGVNSSGNIVQRYEYSTYGTIQAIRDASGTDITSTPYILTNYSFTGREWDPETSLYYYRARYYDPTIGRFLQRDPHPGNSTVPSSVTNKYIYAGNNPLNNVDPSGLFFDFVLGAIFGKGQVREYSQDILLAAAAVAIIIASGGSAAGAFAAVGSVAAGAALAALLASETSGGSFDSHFHSYFRISLGFLVLSAVFAPGGVASAGGNGLQGYIVSANSYSQGYHGGLTIGSAATYNQGSTLGAHEFSHTLHFIAIATFSDTPKDTWERYLAMGAAGRILAWAHVPDPYNPIEFYH